MEYRQCPIPHTCDHRPTSKLGQCLTISTTPSSLTLAQQLMFSCRSEDSAATRDPSLHHETPTTTLSHEHEACSNNKQQTTSNKQQAKNNKQQATYEKARSERSHPCRCKLSRPANFDRACTVASLSFGMQYRLKSLSCVAWWTQYTHTQQKERYGMPFVQHATPDLPTRPTIQAPSLAPEQPTAGARHQTLSCDWPPNACSQPPLPVCAGL